MTFYIDEKSLGMDCKSKRARGRPRLFSHPLIQLLLILKIQYKMPYRALGFAKDILPLLLVEPSGCLATQSSAEERRNSALFCQSLAREGHKL